MLGVDKLYYRPLHLLSSLEKQVLTWIMHLDLQGSLASIQPNASLSEPLRNTFTTREPQFFAVVPFIPSSSASNHRSHCLHPVDTRRPGSRLDSRQLRDLLLMGVQGYMLYHHTI